MHNRKIIILSSSLFTDRILLYSTFFKNHNKNDLDIEIWTTSYPMNLSVFQNLNVNVKEFPKINNFRERFNYLRKISNTAWANKLNAFSILSMKKFNYKYFSFRTKFQTSLIDFFAAIINLFKLETRFENYLHKVLLTQSRSSSAYELLKEQQPDVLFVTNPFWLHESAIAIEAKKLGIKIYSFIPSWDNITTKTRFVFKSDFYAVWSEIRMQELITYYPFVEAKQVDIVGAPQYDIFFNTNFYEEKNVFLNKHELSNNLPIILYVLGSPLFLKSEFQTCVDFINQTIQYKSIEKFQILVRPHPNKDNDDLVDQLKNIHPNVKIQSFNLVGKTTEKRTQTEEQIVDWISTFKYTDVLINLSSTSIFDSLYFNKPVININFDHTFGRKYDTYIKEINSKWIHLKTVYDSNSINYVDSIKDVNDFIVRFLNNEIDLNIDKKHQILNLICNNEMGNSGEILLNSLLRRIK